ncbi:electron transporter RnfD [Ectothiorhodospira haloalkaliphila]|uniref:Ion-translocating oxidoreductase complex subunit D n=1 Tax=Ectothiorhodospira haloalkaliphila TaxID=421628 RepID=W8KSF0_9GAMM|nr:MULTISPECIES: electron transport complex subunit RsxD [Ectothiorhodospira]AHK79947.1 electron transporter RnfD [Ectothiorhodospira haloalkaliphila]MCG5493592.1 electron transport complex subunit RsxD [Ectothiorhodospira variabilis]MCG5496939.1 electron transport complex subunit RsxD [Ectothiorhodospira variabilis]MCG5502921.1 electron transport complex subunit RsxD [Ectothiorhodospira variabilis]MCG5506291.1 electron transport complex subunit RsxD [Ectothiorhodospira variabilis]
MRFKTFTSPHMSPARSVNRVMRQVLYALVPGTVAMAWFFGWGVLVNVVLAVTVALAAEALMLMARRRPVKPFVTDLSAVVAGWLFALAVPPLTPWWITLIGVGFAIVVAKHLYGGLGYNPFNPAMVGYVAVVISFPREMTLWLPPSTLAEMAFSLPQTLQAIFLGQLPAGLTWDMITGATPLDRLQTELAMDRSLSDIQASPFFGAVAGRGWEWINLFFLLGGLWLIRRRVITWHVPVAMLGSLALISGLFWLINPEVYASPLFHLFSGAAILGAFFIATDPVSGSTTPMGRLVFGAGVGILAYVIRAWGGYAEGVAFAILLMNMMAPTIDHYTQPRVFGKTPARKEG